MKETRPWWPFTANELQVALGIYGFVATSLAFAGLPSSHLAWLSLGVGALFYLAGLLVHARRAAVRLVLIPQGAVSGTGHLAPFREVRRCLFLMHLDDDPPNRELLALYRVLLDRGVEIRRVVFLRADAVPSAYSWLVDFGDHDHLQQRVVLPEQARAVRFSFAVVDQATVMLSVPGWEAIDGDPYTANLVLRHLLLIRDRSVASVFLTIHEQTWDRALPLQTVAELSDRKALLARCTNRGAA